MDHHVPGDGMINEHHHQMMDGVGEHHHHVQHDPNDMVANHVHNQGNMEAWAPQLSLEESNENLKRIILDLQRHWLNDFQRQREKLLIEVTEKLHDEFLADEEKTRSELVNQFKEELDTTKEELDKKYRDNLKFDLSNLEERHRKDMASTKRQQWCYQCEKEAIYPCCWNTAYCGVDCQQAHWPNHKKQCRRKKGGGAGAPAK